MGMRLAQTPLASPQVGSNYP